jgi:tRNA 2-selenouridine synthase
MNAPDRTAYVHVKPGIQPLPLASADLAQFDCIIDTRSPAEFAEDHVPGAQNFPVLDNDERARVGTIYKQVSAFEAKKVGAALVARNIAAHIDRTFREMPKSWRPLVYCWRGGTRSGAMAHILRSVGWSAWQLEGGYKAWRGQVIRDLETLPAPFDYRVICGRTGSGKSRLLDALAAAGQQVLDLERLAAHKGSVLGDLPDDPQPSQKMFESRIWHALSGFDAARPVYVEAESKKVGSLRVPQALIDRMWQGRCFEVATPQSLRVLLLREEYAHFIAHPDRLYTQLDCLVPLHGREIIDGWKALAGQGKWDDFIQTLLERHYDPAYDRSMFKNYRGAAEAERLAPVDIGSGDFSRIAGDLAGIK